MSDGHDSSSITPTISKDDEILITKFKEHQQSAARLSYAEEVRTLISQSIGYGVLSTNSVQYPGYPTGSVIGFAVDEQGLPFFSFSTMSAHTKDVQLDGKVSLTITAKDFKGASEGRVVLIGDVSPVPKGDETTTLRDKYLAKHKDAFWIDFGDFSFYKLTSLTAVRFIGGFAMAGNVPVNEYLSAKPDPIAPFADPVMSHMNDDHADSLTAIVKHYVGLPCTDPKMVSLDRLGMTIKANIELAGGGYSKIRVPFPRPANDRKDIKTILVEMTQASAITN
eukprot:gene17340-22886_t